MSALAKLLRRLDLPRVNDWEFAGGAGTGGATEAQRLFGGLVLAQAAVAAARTVDGAQLHMHSMHALFLRPGQAKTPIRFVVSPIKQGRNYHARLVTALQPDRDGEQTVFQMQASFGRFEHVPDPAHRAEHQDAMRAVPPPAQAKNRDLLRGRDPASMPIEVRMIDALDEDRPSAPTTAIWIRANGELPDDPVLRLATLVYATDRAFLGTAWRPHAGKGRLAGASLDHSLWFHEPITFDDWLLFDMHSPAARFERGLVFGGLYTPDGRRVASASQEGSLAFQPNAPSTAIAQPTTPP